MVLMLPANITYSFIGHKWMLIISTLLSTIGTLLSGRATKLWELYIFYSLFTGCGLCILHVTLLRIVPNWFDETKRSTAFGIITSSIGAGGLLLPLVISSIERNLGATWIFQILAIVTFVTGGIACVLIKDADNELTKEEEKEENINSSNTKEKNNTSETLDFSILKMRKVVFWLMTFITQTMIQAIPTIFLPSYAKYIGLNQEEGTLTLSLLLGMSVPGAISAGIIADKIGNLNTLAFYAFMETLVTAFIWTFANNYQTLQAYSAVYGFFFNSMAGLGSALAIEIVGIQRYPSAMSLLLVASTVCAMGPTIASFIEGKSKLEPYVSYKIMVTIGYSISFILILILRSTFKKKLFVKV